MQDLQDLEALKSKSLSELREIARALGLDIRSGREKLVAKIVGATTNNTMDLGGEEALPIRRPRRRIQPKAEHSARAAAANDNAAEDADEATEPVVAEVEPVVAAEEPTEEVKPKRRGRPRKNPLPEESNDQGATEEIATTEPAAVEEVVAPAEPKRRGRPRKNPLPEDVAPAEVASESAEEEEQINEGPSAEELERNPRSRSAKMRVAVKR